MRPSELHEHILSNVSLHQQLSVSPDFLEQLNWGLKRYQGRYCLQIRDFGRAWVLMNVTLVKLQMPPERLGLTHLDFRKEWNLERRQQNELKILFLLVDSISPPVFQCGFQDHDDILAIWKKILQQFLAFKHVLLWKKATCLQAIPNIKINYVSENQ